MLLDLIAKRYGKLPTEVLPRGTVLKEHELSFNLNVALLSATSEYLASHKDDGRITNKSNARAAIAQAKLDMIEMYGPNGQKYDA